MLRDRLAGLVPFATLLGMSALGACSHEQKPKPATAATIAERALPAAPARPRVAAPEPEAPARVAVAGDPAIFFDFDSAVLRDDSHATLQKMSASVNSRPGAKLRIEGNCDELGTIEYNLALGEHRARAAKEYLVHVGVPRDRITTISYGSQRPKYPGSDDAARAKNRRDDFVVIR